MSPWRAKFWTWLKRQKDRPDRVGDLSRGLLQDYRLNRYKLGRSHRGFLTTWLKRQQVEPKVLEALDQAWAEYEVRRREEA